MQDYPGYIVQSQKQFRFSVVQASIWGGFILLGLLFLAVDYPGLSILLVSSGGMLGYNLVALLLLKGQSLANNIITGTGITWTIILIAGVVFNDGHPCNMNGLIIYTIAGLLAAGINALSYRKYIRELNR
jgi:hypothetical protein